MADGNVSAGQLRLFIERIERLEEEKWGMNDDIKDVYLEAKSQGYDPKTCASSSVSAAWRRTPATKRRRSSGFTKPRWA